MPYYLPILRWGRAYTLDNLVTDALAGLTNGILNLGSGIINGPLAGLNVPAGLLTACFPGFFYTFIASSMFVK
jgi:MFS superfamily sulfate permease-like transporter